MNIFVLRNLHGNSVFEQHKADCEVSKNGIIKIPRKILSRYDFDKGKVYLTTKEDMGNYKISYIRHYDTAVMLFDNDEINFEFLKERFTSFVEEALKENIVRLKEMISKSEIHKYNTLSYLSDLTMPA